MNKVYLDIMPNLGVKNKCYPFFTIHQEMLDHPPQKVNYEIIKHKFKPSSPKTFSVYFKIFKFMNKILHLRDLYYKINEFTQPKDGVIHAGGHIRFGSRPWVADFEHINILLYHDTSKKRIYQLRKSLNSKSCKKLMPWSIKAKDSLEHFYKDKSILEKTEVVYPAVHLPTIEKIKRKDNNINFIFVGFAFNRKGGRETLIGFDKLSKKYNNVKLKMISRVPEVYKKKYSKNKNITFLEDIPREEIYKKHYPNADVFVMLSLKENFGIVFLEAMSYGLPVLGTRQFAIPEIIEEGKNGFLLDLTNPWDKKSPIYSSNSEKYYSKIDYGLAENFFKKSSLLVEDNKLRESMGLYSKKLISTGKFSIKERNKKLKRIYEEASK